MSEPGDRAKAVDLIYAWDDDDSGTYDDLAELIADAIAAERERARAPFLTLADEMESDGKGDSGYMEYHEGFNAALVSAAKSIRAAAQDQP